MASPGLGCRPVVLAGADSRLPEREIGDDDDHAPMIRRPREILKRVGPVSLDPHSLDDVFCGLVDRAAFVDRAAACLAELRKLGGEKLLDTCDHLVIDARLREELVLHLGLAYRSDRETEAPACEPEFFFDAARDGVERNLGRAFLFFLLRVCGPTFMSIHR